MSAETLQPQRPGHRAVYLLPNLVTTLCLFSGFYSIVHTIHGDFVVASWAIVVAALFDAIDGRVARLTRTTSPFGVQFDSLSDLVAFGVAPSILIYSALMQPWGRLGWLGAFLFLACGALRLARFNVTTQKVGLSSFTGLPIPTAAVLVATGFILLLDGGLSTDIMRWALAPLIVLLSLLMISTVPYPSFKQVVVPSKRAFQFLAGVVILLVLVASYPALFMFIMALVYAAVTPLVGLWLVRKIGRPESDSMEAYELEDEDILEEENGDKHGKE
jgi:CDP-diacylglycerol---serine O-phosphatidyltransferase